MGIHWLFCFHSLREFTYGPILLKYAPGRKRCINLIARWIFLPRGRRNFPVFLSCRPRFACCSGTSGSNESCFFPRTVCFSTGLLVVIKPGGQQLSVRIIACSFGVRSSEWFSLCKLLVHESLISVLSDIPARQSNRKTMNRYQLGTKTVDYGLWSSSCVSFGEGHSMKDGTNQINANY